MLAKCTVCPNACMIEPATTGACAVRINQSGQSVDSQFGKVVVAQAEPIEKKPLAAFMPGSWSYSFGLTGCNLSCAYCRNHKISRASRPTLVPAVMTAEAVVAQAVKAGLPSVCATFTEPGLHREFIADVFTVARSAGLATIIVTNGFWSIETCDLLTPLIDAATLSIKGDNGFYQKFCGASLLPVQQTAIRLQAAGCHIELITPLVSGANDSQDQLDELAAWISANLGPHINWHLAELYRADRMQSWPDTHPGSFTRALLAGRQHGISNIHCEGSIGESAQAAWQSA